MHSLTQRPVLGLPGNYYNSYNILMHNRKVPHKSVYVAPKVPHKSVLIFQNVPHKNVIYFAISLIFSIFAAKNAIYGKIYHARPHCLEKQRG